MSELYQSQKDMFSIIRGTQISGTDDMKVEVGVSRGTKGANRKIEGQVSRGTGVRGNMLIVYYLLGRIHLTTCLP